MRNGAHMRLTLTRGEKCTSSMNPLFNVYGTTLIILPEWKPTEGATTYDNEKGITLITAGTCRRSPPSTLDNKIHHNNMIQNILPKIQANSAGAADSIMLDVEGFVAETNATNLFLVAQNRDEDGKLKPVLVTPTGDHCLPGITRDTVLILAKELGIKTEVRRVSLTEFYCADEVFTTGNHLCSIYLSCILRTTLIHHIRNDSHTSHSYHFNIYQRDNGRTFAGGSYR